MKDQAMNNQSGAEQVFEHLLTLVPLDRQADAMALRGQVRPEKALVQSGILSEQVLAVAYAESLSIPLLQDDERPEVSGEDIGLSASFLREKECIPFQDAGDALIMAMTDPLNQETIRAVEMATSKKVLPLVATPQQVISLLSQQGASPSLVTVDAKTDHPQEERMEGAARDLHRILEDALAQGASDIHLEAGGNGLRLRMRMDGLLKEMPSGLSSTGEAEKVLGRLKVLAGLDIAEQRVPQDGRIQEVISGRKIDLRVSIIPGLYGESAVVRLLNPEAGPQDLRSLGFHDRLITGMNEILAQPHGLFLVTGPTGAGKTTTLYALLRQLNNPSRKILTIEDPVEYQLDGIMQVAARPQVGFGFAHALRSFLRHDPDVLMVGEIRDEETARVAVQAALTGHLVLSTVHTNDAFGAVDRLLDMGVEPYLLASVLRGVLAQRLVRKSCPSCHQAADLPARYAGFLPAQMKDVVVAKGCASCHDAGYKGRFAIGELLTMNDALSGLVAGKASRDEMLRVAKENGFVSLKEDGIEHLGEQDTTPDELLRHLGDLL